MAEVKWTLQAVEDFESIVEFISKDSLNYAYLLAADIFEAVDKLCTFPESGRIVPEVDVIEIREILFRNYRIIYRTKKDFVEIITIYHGARILDPQKIV